MIKSAMRFIGQVWGRTFLRYVVLAYMRSRVSQFDVREHGIDYLMELQGQSYILVSNHIPPRDTLLKILTLKPLQRFNHAIDSFVYQQVIHHHTGRWINVVAKYGRDIWYRSGPMLFLQKNVRQPLTLGQLEGVGYVPVDLKEGAMQRDFLKSVDRIVRRRGALLIFPEGGVSDEFHKDSALRGGAAHLARKYQIPILPAHIEGSYTWQPGHRVTVRFGPCIRVTGLNKQQIVAEIKRSIVALGNAANGGEVGPASSDVASPA